LMYKLRNFLNLLVKKFNKKNYRAKVKMNMYSLFMILFAVCFCLNIQLCYSKTVHEDSDDLKTKGPLQNKKQSHDIVKKRIVMKLIDLTKKLTTTTTTKRMKVPSYIEAEDIRF